MNKEQLLIYMDSILCIDMSINNIEKNELSIKPKRIMVFALDFDEIAIYETETEIIVSINGSDDKKEWKNNFHLYPILYNTHNGFYNRASLYLEKIKDVLDKLVKETDKPVVFTGYSRGGALVQVMCWKWNKPLTCVTFGSPRVFTVSGIKSLTFKHVRVHSKFDPIVRIPMVWILPFFKHYQTEEIKIDKRIKSKFSHTNYKELIQEFL